MPTFKIRRLTPTAKMPEKSTRKATGYDIFCDRVEDTGTQLKVYTGLAIQPEENYYIEVFPRSSIYKKNLQLANSIGLIDYDYRGEIILIFNKIPLDIKADIGGCYPDLVYNSKISVGEKIAQMVIRWRFDAEWEEVENLDETERGIGGFGSTGS